MANKRMFAKDVIRSDAFSELSNNAKAFYYAVSMEADDDGICNRARSIMRENGCGEEIISEFCRLFVNKRYGACGMPEKAGR